MHPHSSVWVVVSEMHPSVRGVSISHGHVLLHNLHIASPAFTTATFFLARNPKYCQTAEVVFFTRNTGAAYPKNA